MNLQQVSYQWNHGGNDNKGQHPLYKPDIAFHFGDIAFDFGDIAFDFAEFILGRQFFKVGFCRNFKGSEIVFSGQPFKIGLGCKSFINKLGLFIGQDFSLGFRHSRGSQPFNKFMCIKSNCVHGPHIRLKRGDCKPHLAEKRVRIPGILTDFTDSMRCM